MDYINHINYKEGDIIFNLLFYKSHPNILLYGVKNSGKTSLIKCILNDKKIKSFYNQLSPFNNTKIIENINEII